MNAQSGLRVESIRFAYDQLDVVRGASLNVAPGECVVIVGPSGSGKSTLLRLIAGMLKPRSGRIVHNGQLLDAVPMSRRGIGYIMDNWALYPHKSVKGNLEYPLRLRHIPRSVREERVNTIARRLGIAELLSRKPSEISAGEAQRVALGRALVRDDLRILLADEPFASLDPALRQALRHEFRAITSEFGTCSIIVTHDQADASVSDHVVVLNDGEVLQDGTIAELYHEPANVFVARFVGSVPMNLIPSTVLFQRAQAANRVEGPDVLIGVRAEKVQLVPTSEADLRGLIRTVESNPPSAILGVDCNGAQISVITSDKRMPGIGETVGLSIDLTGAARFDASTGRRI